MAWHYVFKYVFSWHYVFKYVFKVKESQLEDINGDSIHILRNAIEEVGMKYWMLE